MVTETDYVSYYVDATSKTEAIRIWSDVSGYEGDKRVVEDNECEITGIEEVTQ
jgi:hypothetical protein